MVQPFKYWIPKSLGFSVESGIPVFSILMVTVNPIAHFSFNLSVLNLSMFFFLTGEHKGDNFYYAFDGQGTPMDVDEVIFTFHDMSNHSVRLADCRDVGKEQLWT